MRSPLVRTCVLSCALLVPINSYADPVAVVNGETITQQDYDVYVKARTEQHRNMPDAQALIEELVQRELLKQDALNNNIDKTPEFISKLEYLRDSLLMAMGMHNHLEKNPLDDATLKAEYDKEVAHLKIPKEYLVRHILVDTESEAEAIIAEIVDGKTFGELAKEKSTDIGSAKNGGDLGWITKSGVVSEFGDTVEKLEKGKYTTTPVKTKYGWHIIQINDIRTASLSPFEKVKEKIRSALQAKQMQQYMSSLRKPAKVEITKPNQ